MQLEVIINNYLCASLEKKFIFTDTGLYCPRLNMQFFFSCVLLLTIYYTLARREKKYIKQGPHPLNIYLLNLLKGQGYIKNSDVTPLRNFIFSLYHVRQQPCEDRQEMYSLFLLTVQLHTDYNKCQVVWALDDNGIQRKKRSFLLGIISGQIVLVIPGIGVLPTCGCLSLMEPP